LNWPEGVPTLAGGQPDQPKNFTKWRQEPVELNRIRIWVNTDLRRGWGFKAAARASHIEQTGFDAAIVGPYRGNAPTTSEVKNVSYVPGALPQAANLYHIRQVRAWLAQGRRDLEEPLQSREQISGLLKPLMN
jgi:hypothetical protein